MEIKPLGFARFVVSDGIVDVYCHIEQQHGIKQLWIDKIVIHGTIEASHLITILRKIYRYFVEKHDVF